MFSCFKHVCMPDMSILNAWDILKPHNSLVLACIKVLFDWCLKGFTVILNVWAAGPSNKSY